MPLQPVELPSRHLQTAPPPPLNFAGVASSCNIPSPGSRLSRESTRRRRAVHHGPARACFHGSPPHATRKVHPALPASPACVFSCSDNSSDIESSGSPPWQRSEVQFMSYTQRQHMHLRRHADVGTATCSVRKFRCAAAWSS